MRGHRVAFFTDSFHEVNGVALTSRCFHNFAVQRQIPFLSVHAGPTTRRLSDGPVTTLELERKQLALSLERDLKFDLLFLRHWKHVLDELRAFRPDVVHITSPGDVGILGVALASKLGIRIAASWHTNIHEYASRRLHNLLDFLPPGMVAAVADAAERHSLGAAGWFYGLAEVLFAPNQELVDMLRGRTGKPCYIMRRGVDSQFFNPARRDPGKRPFTIGYVGRLSPEKSVRNFAQIERDIEQAGFTDFRILIVGDGSEKAWLRENVRRAELTGVLSGEPLARAYANMDVFAFPSHTDTFGNVVQEAMASGVPVVVTTGGGPKFLVKPGVTGFVAIDEPSFSRYVIDLMRDPGLHRMMQRSAREYALSISWDRVFEQVHEAYAAELPLPAPLRA
jgi:glycosyltransferase involved in cell wall biosynthesis